VCNDAHVVRRGVWALGIAAALALPGTVGATGPRGCVSTDPSNPVTPNPCRYVATSDSTYAAAGDWELTIQRGGQTIALSSDHGDPADGLPGTVHSGDVVFARALSRGSSVVVGDPSPLAPSPATPPWTPPPYATKSGFVSSFDGTRIAWWMYLPKGADATHPVPAVVAFHGLGGTHADWDPAHPSFTPDLLRHGYAVLAPDSRGFGASGGTSELDAPDVEARDVTALLDLLGREPEIQQDAPGDPRVGFVGGSLGGAIQLTTAALDHRVDAITPDDTFNNLDEALAPQGVPRSGWFTAFNATAALAVARNGGHGGVDPLVPKAALEADTTGTLTPDVRGFLRSRGPWSLLDRVAAPTLVLHGSDDSAFAPSQAQATYDALRTSPLHPQVALRFYCGGHGATCDNGVFTYSYFDDVLAWLDRWVRRDPTVAVVHGFRYPTQDGALHDAPSYPPPATSALTATGAGGTVVVNSEPTVGGNGDYAPLLPSPTGVPLSSPMGRPEQPAVTSLKLPLPATTGLVAGPPAVTLLYSGTGGSSDKSDHVPLFFRLIDRRTDQVLNDQETPRLLTLDGAEHQERFRLEPVEWQGAAHDRLALEVVTDSETFEPYHGAAVVQLHRIAVRVPVVAGVHARVR
jgi:ABC-2 type transport system ATP-binding protein